MSTPTSRPTRQQLDELDALLQRMLSLPGGSPEPELPSPPPQLAAQQTLAPQESTMAPLSAGAASGFSTGVPGAATTAMPTPGATSGGMTMTAGSSPMIPGTVNMPPTVSPGGSVGVPPTIVAPPPPAGTLMNSGPSSLPPSPPVTSAPATPSSTMNQTMPSAPTIASPMPPATSVPPPPLRRAVPPSGTHLWNVPLPANAGGAAFSVWPSGIESLTSSATSTITPKPSPSPPMNHKLNVPETPASAKNGTASSSDRSAPPSNGVNPNPITTRIVVDPGPASVVEQGLPFYLWPFGLVDRMCGGILSAFGPPGRWLGQGGGKMLIGWAGMLMLAGAVVWGVMDYFGLYW